jgi:site-specific DNA-methyltransferase (adenine-specific)
MIYEVNGTGAKGSNLAYWQTWEYAFVFAKGKLATFNPLSSGKKISSGGNRRLPNGDTKTGNWRDTEKEGRRSNIWRYNAGNNSGDDAIGDHPAKFPEALARDHILSWSNEGDIVLDPFSGSGTTAKMAKHNGRRFIGIEVNQEYCDIAEKRLAQDVLF